MRFREITEAFEKERDMRITRLAMLSGMPLNASETAKVRWAGERLSIYTPNGESHSSPVTLSDGNIYSVHLTKAW